MKLRPVLSGFVLTLGLAVSASAGPTSLYDYALFAGGGLTTNTPSPEIHLGTDTLVNGLVGSNQDVRLLSGATVVASGMYVGGYLDMGSNSVVGSPSLLSQVVVGGSNSVSGKEASINGTIYGSLAVTGDVDLGSNANVTGSIQYTGGLSENATSDYGSATQVAATTAFSTVAMPASSTIVAGSIDKTCTGGCSSLTLDPGSYRDLSIGTDKVLYLKAGDYYFNSISSNSNLTLNLDVTSGPINIYVVGVVDFGSNHHTKLKGAGTGVDYVDPSAATALASLVYLETLSKFNINSNTQWAGTVYASKFESGSPESYVGTGVTWWGAVYAFDSVEIRQDTTINYVRSYLSPDLTTAAAVPEPTSLILLGSGLAIVARRLQRRKSKTS